MHSELPPSSSDKWLHCHGWLKLNRALPDTSSSAADEGTLAHSLLEHMLLSACAPEVVGKLPPRPKVPVDMDDTISSVAEWVLEQPGQVLAEEQVDYGSQFGFHGLFGTSDTIILEPDRLTVADLKYGFGIVEVEWNPQLMIYLSGAVAKYGRREKYRVAVLQPRGRHNDGPIRTWEFGDKELDEFNKLLSLAIHKNYKGGKPTVGDYCRKYCKALGVCPAAARAAVAVFKENPID